MDTTLESTSLAQRIVLCCLLDSSEVGETPVDTAELREAAEGRLEDSDVEAVGHLTEADVMRALNGLSDAGLVEERHPGDRSPVGKGRPEYVLAVDDETLREELLEDDRVSPLLK